MTYRKRQIVALSVIVMLAALAISGTLAYFTTEGTAHNVITTGGVEVALHEWSDVEKTQPFPQQGISGVMPGTEVTKIVEAENTGASPVWVRMQAEKSISLGEQGEADLSLIQLDFNTKDWTLWDGWYYYNAALTSGETTPPLFTTVRFDAAMGDPYQNSTAAVDVTVQGVQIANNGETALDAAGWPEQE